MNFKTKKWSVLLWSIFLVMFITFSFITISNSIRNNLEKSVNFWTTNTKTTTYTSQNYIYETLWENENYSKVITKTWTWIITLLSGWPIVYSWSLITSSWSFSLNSWNVLKIQNLWWIAWIKIDNSNEVLKNTTQTFTRTQKIWEKDVVVEQWFE